MENSRLTITELGQNLRQEILEQNQRDQIFKKQNKLKEKQLKNEQEEKMFSQLDITQQVNQIQSTNNAGYNQNQNAKSDIAQTLKKIQAGSSASEILAIYNYDVIRKSNNPKKITNFLLPQDKLENASPYIQQKLQQATQEILNIGTPTVQNKEPNRIQTAKSKSIFNEKSFFQSNSNFFKPQSRYLDNRSNFLQNETNQNMLQSQVQSNKLSLEQIVNKRQNKMVFYESKFSKMYDNHQQNIEIKNSMKSNNDLRSLIEKNAEKEHLTTRPETLQEINSKHPAALQIIGFQSNARKREKEILYSQHVKQYGIKWSKSYFPRSKQERQEMGLSDIRYKPKLTPIKRNYNNKGKKDGWCY